MISDRIVLVCWLSAVASLSGCCGESRSGSGCDLLKDGLVGWQQVGEKPGGWWLEDGVLYTRVGRGGWLATNREYADFILELEFKVPAGGNSGVFIRAPLEGDPVYMGMEIQILDDYADKYTKLRAEQFTGSIYGVQAPSERATRSGGRRNQWQKMVIVCKGPKLQVVVNGLKVVDTSVEYYSHKYDKHPGLKRTSGYIGLQDHSGRVEFRNVTIREL